MRSVNPTILLREALLYLWRATTLFFVSTYLFSIPLGFFVMLLSQGGSEFSQTSTGNLPVGLFTIFVVRLPLTATFGTVFVLVSTIYALCFAVAWRINGGFIQALRGKIPQRPTSASSNLLFILPVLSSSILVLVALIQGLQETAGLPTGSIEFANPYRGLFELAYSPIFEEVMYRISPFAAYYVVNIGLTLSAKGESNAKSYLKSVSLSIAFPDRAKEVSGSPNIRTNGILRGVNRAEWALVALTSVVFGLAHYLSGSGWEIGKITSSSIAGLAFSLAYLTFGFHAPILLHWFFNYYPYIYEVAAQNYDGIFGSLEELANLSVELVGLAAILAFSIYLVRRIVRGVFTTTGLEVKKEEHNDSTAFRRPIEPMKDLKVERLG